MCDYSLHSVRTRPAKVGETLVTHNFGTGTRGFAAPEDCSVAVCVLPGTELAFEAPVPSLTSLLSAPTIENLLIIRVTIDSGWHFLGLPSARPHCPQGCRNVVGT